MLASWRAGGPELPFPRRDSADTIRPALFAHREAGPPWDTSTPQVQVREYVMTNSGVFGWIRESVRRSVLLGFSDAVEQIGGAADGNEELHPQLAAVLRRPRPVRARQPRRRARRQRQNANGSAARSSNCAGLASPIPRSLSRATDVVCRHSDDSRGVIHASAQWPLQTLANLRNSPSGNRLRVNLAWLAVTEAHSLHFR